MENVNQAQLTNFIMRTSNQREKDLGTACGGVMHSTPRAGTRPRSIQVWKDQLHYPKGDTAPFWHLREGKWKAKRDSLGTEQTACPGLFERPAWSNKSRVKLTKALWKKLWCREANLFNIKGLMEEDVLWTTGFQMFLFKRPWNASQQKQGN